MRSIQAFILVGLVGTGIVSGLACSSEADDEDGVGASGSTAATGTGNTKGTGTTGPSSSTGMQTSTVELTGDITASQTLSADTLYILKGVVKVAAGATLTIEKGTVIQGDKATLGTLVIQQGAKIMAVGTADEPIVFTSRLAPGSRAPGDWGGVILLGKAPINTAGGTASIEGLSTNEIYGGADAADSSGTMQYVRIEFSGVELSPDNEINGLTMGGVGTGTVIDHIMVKQTLDDCFEWFGGTVNAKNLIAFGGLDDDFDMDNGFSGNVQFGLVLRDPNQADVSGSNGLEHDNDASGTTASPFTSPALSNITILGPLVTSDPGSMNSNYKRSAHLRRNTHTKVYNSVLTGYPTGLLIDGATTEANATNNDLQVRNTVLAGMTTDFGVASGSTWDISSWFNTTGWNNAVYTSANDLGLGLPVSLTNPQLLPEGASPLMSGADFSATALTNSFFENVSYRGAFGSTDWTSGWTNWDPQNTSY